MIIGPAQSIDLAMALRRFESSRFKSSKFSCDPFNAFIPPTQNRGDHSEGLSPFLVSVFKLRVSISPLINQKVGTHQRSQATAHLRAGCLKPCFCECQQIGYYGV
jgi:hypothetical protein